MIRVQDIATTPEDVGVDSERLEALFARVRRDVEDGVLPSAQVAVPQVTVVAFLQRLVPVTSQ